MLDDVLQRNPTARSWHAVQARRNLGHFHARKKLLTLTGSLQHHAKTDAHVGDEWKPMSWIHRQRREDWKHIVAKPRASLILLVDIQPIPFQKINLLLAKRW